MREFSAGKLVVKVAKNRDELGRIGCEAVVNRIVDVLKKKKNISIIFASAPSQNEFLTYLKQETCLDWQRIRAFNMDEYVGIDPSASQGFGNFLNTHLYQEVKPKAVYLFNSLSNDPEVECERYGKLLLEFTPDIVIYGVGENGHLAFNDPPVADFNDSKGVKIVKLDEVCRQQQVNDGCFESIDKVPTHAFTLTIPTLMKVPYLFGMVPGKTKIEAITHLINDEISTQCPATILKTHPNAVLFIDEDSASKLSNN